MPEVINLYFDSYDLDFVMDLYGSATDGYLFKFIVISFNFIFLSVASCGWFL